MKIRETFVCELLRIPVGKFGGAYREVDAPFLGAAVVSGLLERSGLPAEAVGDVLFAQCYASIEAPAFGRVVALDAGLSITVGGLQLDRRYGSGLQALIYAYPQVATGGSNVVIAGGAESMSNAPFLTHGARWGVKGPVLELQDGLLRGRVTAGGQNFPVPSGMLETAENLRREYRITRQAQDEFAFESQHRTLAA